MWLDGNELWITSKIRLHNHYWIHKCSLHMTHDPRTKWTYFWSGSFTSLNSKRLHFLDHNFTNRILKWAVWCKMLAMLLKNVSGTIWRNRFLKTIPKNTFRSMLNQSVGNRNDRPKSTFNLLRKKTKLVIEIGSVVQLATVLWTTQDNIRSDRKPITQFSLDWNGQLFLLNKRMFENF